MSAPDPAEPPLFADLPVQISIDDLIGCATRELRMRELVYPKRIASGHMEPAFAQLEIVKMRAIVAHLQNAKARKQ